MEITRIKNVKDFPIVEQSEISEVLAYDAEGNLIRAKYGDIDLSGYYTKGETDGIIAPVSEKTDNAYEMAAVALTMSEIQDEEIKQLNDSVDSVYSSLNQWKNETKESLVSELEDWVSETDTLAKEAKTKADNAQNSAWAAQAAAETADAKADANAEDIREINEWAEIAQTTIDEAWATAKDSNEKATTAQTTANTAQTTANNALNSAAAAQAASEVNSEDIRVINATIGDINNILSSL